MRSRLDGLLLGLLCRSYRRFRLLHDFLFHHHFHDLDDLLFDHYRFPRYFHCLDDFLLDHHRFPRHFHFLDNFLFHHHFYWDFHYLDDLLFDHHRFRRHFDTSLTTSFSTTTVSPELPLS